MLHPLFIFALFVDSNGVESSADRTAERFSLCDYMMWADEIRHIVHTDWLEMRSELIQIASSNDGERGRMGGRKESLVKMCDVWEQGGVRLEGD